MKKAKTFLISINIILCNFIFAQNENKRNEVTQLSIGEKIEFQSKILKENRILNIYLPNGYSKDSLKEYPVIYLLDGSIDEDFIHISQ